MRLLVTLLLTLNLFGCSTVNWAKNAYKVNMHDVKDNCKTEEIYELNPFRSTNLVAMRFDKCLEIDNLFVMMWPGTDGEYNSTLANLLVLEYLRLHNLNNDKDNQLGHIYLKTEEVEENVYARFWQFKKVKIEVESDDNTSEK